VAEGTDEREVIRPSLGVSFSNPLDFAIVGAGGTECQPSREIRNVPVNRYRHTFIIPRYPGVCPADVRSRPALRGRVRHLPFEPRTRWTGQVSNSIELEQGTNA